MEQESSGQVGHGNIGSSSSEVPPSRSSSPPPSPTAASRWGLDFGLGELEVGADPDSPTAAQFDSVSSHLHCSICIEVLGTNGGPATLPCGHNFCRDCVNQVLMGPEAAALSSSYSTTARARSSGRAACPICRQPYTGHVPVGVNRELREVMQGELETRRKGVEAEAARVRAEQEAARQQALLQQQLQARREQEEEERRREAARRAEEEQRRQEEERRVEEEEERRREAARRAEEEQQQREALKRVEEEEQRRQELRRAEEEQERLLQQKQQQHQQQQHQQQQQQLQPVNDSSPQVMPSAGARLGSADNLGRALQTTQLHAVHEARHHTGPALRPAGPADSPARSLSLQRNGSRNSERELRASAAVTIPRVASHGSAGAMLRAEDVGAGSPTNPDMGIGRGGGGNGGGDASGIPLPGGSRIRGPATGGGSPGASGAVLRGVLSLVKGRGRSRDWFWNSAAAAAAASAAASTAEQLAADVSGANGGGSGGGNGSGVAAGGYAGEDGLRCVSYPSSHHEQQLPSAPPFFPPSPHVHMSSQAQQQQNQNLQQQTLPQQLWHMMCRMGGGQDEQSVIQRLLEAEPPEWVPDSHSRTCMRCHALFRPLVCMRHHCRFCGHLVCDACSRGRALLPRLFREGEPQRVCDGCHEALMPVQRALVTAVAPAAQTATHDVTDWTSGRAWVNNPWGRSLQEEIYKATNTLRAYSQVGQLNPERSIPSTVLRGARGLAILTVAKCGAGVTYKLGSGLVVTRLPDGRWSAPSAVATGGMGWGAQMGAEVADLIVVLRDLDAIKMFCGQYHLALGASVSAAAGPVGRVLEADFRAGRKGTATCYTYCCSKGAFVGMSWESSVISACQDANMRFYGTNEYSPRDLLFGNVPPPRAAEPLYRALDELFQRVEAECAAARSASAAAASSAAAAALVSAGAAATAAIGGADGVFFDGALGGVGDPGLMVMGGADGGRAMGGGGGGVMGVGGGGGGGDGGRARGDMGSHGQHLPPYAHQSPFGDDEDMYSQHDMFGHQTQQLHRHHQHPQVHPQHLLLQEAEDMVLGPPPPSYDTCYPTPDWPPVSLSTHA